MYKGKLFWDDDQRLQLLGCLLENLGAAATVQLGDAAVWKRAVAALE